MKKTIKNLLIITPAILLFGCGDNTTSPVIKDVKSVEIDHNISIYATDNPLKINSTVTYTDSTTSSINDSDLWENSNYDVLSMYNGTITPISNGGSATVSLNVGHLSDSVDVNVIKLVDFYLSYSDVNTTGEHVIEAIGTFENNQTKKIYTNIVWEINNTATVTTDENYITTIDIASGDTNLTATVFGDDNETNITKSIIFSIN